MLIYLRYSVTELKKVPGIKTVFQLANMVTRAECGTNLVMEALKEVGVIQYLRNAKLGKLDHEKNRNNNTMTRITTTNFAGGQQTFR